MRKISCIFAILVSIPLVQNARILGVFYMPVYSHFILGETVFKELALRGHDVTVISPFPQKEKLRNYKDIYLGELSELVKFILAPENLYKVMQQYPISIIKEVYDNGNLFTKLSLKNMDVQNLLKSNETFDVIILEQFINEAHFGFMHRFKSPLILMTTMSSSILSNQYMGNPTPFAYIPNIFMDYSPRMNFWQRIYNTFLSSLQVFYYHTYFLPEQDRILRENFPDSPSLYDLIYNVSIVLLNSHPTCAAAVPLQPNMIEIGGFHVVQNQEPLSEDLMKYLDESREGVIYFSLGSNFLGKYVTREKLRSILKVFSGIKMNVLWKYEDDDLPGKPDNVRVEKWLPQQTILAHDNVKVFITHGGRLSTIEAIYYGKPLLGIPIFAEQRYNVREAAYLGYGIYLSYDDLNEENLSNALIEIIKNPKYTEEAEYRSQVLRNLPITQLDRAISWIEYVIKHKGAPHLRNASVHLRWYQYLLLDVALLCCISIWISKKLLSVLFSKLFKVKSEKLKVN